MSTKLRILLAGVMFWSSIALIGLGVLICARSIGRWGPSSADSEKAARAHEPAPSHPELRGPEWKRDGINRPTLRDQIRRDYLSGK